MKKRNIIEFIALLILLGTLLGSCKKFVTPKPSTTQLLSSTVFENDAAADAAMAGIYSQMYALNNNTSTYGGYHLSILASLSADELIYPAVVNHPFYINDIKASNQDIGQIWSSSYALIYNANMIIENVPLSQGITPAVAKQLTGEALFIRSFCHFYLACLFGDIPYISSTDVGFTKNAPRASYDSVLKYITSDLVRAKTLLSEDYQYSNGERVRANKWAASALLARVYLYRKQWLDAQSEATVVIDKTGLFTLEQQLDRVFSKNSRECIWQLLSYGGQGYTLVGNLCIPASAADIPTFILSDGLMAGFENGDLRKAKWTRSNFVDGKTYYYPNKYRSTQNLVVGDGDYYSVLRLAELYFVRAEAAARQGLFEVSQADINTIRSRAGLFPINVNDESSAMAAIEQERRSELFTEWADRWINLRRTGRIADVLKLTKPNFTIEKALYPIPGAEIAINPKLTQNPSY